jgi:hypothetical protein
MVTKHTPGTAGAPDESIGELQNSSNLLFAEVDRLREVNAEMLELLESILANNSPHGILPVARIRAAIDRARGES